MAGSTNKAAVPEAKGALDRFKYEVYRCRTVIMETLRPDRMDLWAVIWSKR